MKKIIVGMLVVVFLVTLLSYSVFSQTRGRFTIGNEPPYIISDSFAVQDSVSTWDNNIVIDTHDINTKIRFNVKDSNPDTLNVRLCIGTSATPSLTSDCNVVNYDFPVVAPGQHSGLQGKQLVYTYNTDPTGILQGIPGTISFVQTDCIASTCSKTYYVDIIISDGLETFTSSGIYFNLINNLPNTPSLLTPAQTHDQTPTLSWTATDPDDGSIDKWPVDTLIYHIQVGTGYSDETYLADPLSSTPSATVANAIPWGAPGDLQAVATAYARIWSTDNLGINSDNYDNSFSLIDNLPQFSNIYVSDSAINIGTDSCVDFFPQNCFISPLSGGYTSVNIKLKFDDSDADCSALSHNSKVVLCRVDSASQDVCDLINNVYRAYDLNFESSAGSTCYFSVSIPSGDSRGIEFFSLPGVYKMFIQSNSQAGTSTTLWNYLWEYSSLQAIQYAGYVTLGDSVIDGGDGIQLGLWNPGLSLASMINHGNKALNLQWDATDASSDASVCNGHTATCWDLSTSDNLLVDDDNSVVDDTGNLAAVNVPETPTRALFVPAGGLDVCDSNSCNSVLLDETLNTYFHISPPSGLSPGDYETIFTITINPI